MQIEGKINDGPHLIDNQGKIDLVNICIFMNIILVDLKP